MYLGLGLRLGSNRGGGSSVSITATSSPTGQLEAGENASADLPSFATFDSTANYSSTGGTISSVDYQINGVSDAGTGVLAEGDIPSFLVTDSAANTQRFSLPAVIAATTQLTAVIDDPNDEVDLTSTEAGTCYYAIFADGTATPTAAAVVAGTGAISNGTAGIFVSAGTLADTEISFAGLSASTDYEIFFVVDINDGGTYTNVAGGGFATPADITAPTISSAATDVAGDTITITANENLAGSSTAGDWTINGVSAGAPTIDSVTISTTTITLEISGNLVANGDTVTVDYSGTGITDTTGNALATFTGQAVTNNVPGSYSEVAVTAGSGVYLTAGAAMPANAKSVVIFASFDNVSEANVRGVLASWGSSTTDQLNANWASVGSDGNIEPRLAMNDDGGGSVAADIGSYADNSRLHIIVKAWTDGSNLNYEVQVAVGSGAFSVALSGNNGSGAGAVLDLGTSAAVLFARRDNPALWSFGGRIYRLALWSSTADTDPLDITANASDFVSGGVTVNPTTSQATLTAMDRQIDMYGAASRYNAGTNDGLLSMTATGTFT